MGAAMNLLTGLFAANKFKQIDQRCVGGNGLPFSHHTLRVNNFTRQHGATVHRELQNVHHLFSAIHFHVRACGDKVSTPLRLLGRSVIKQAPEGSDGARSFDGAIVNINNARIGGGHFLPFSVRLDWGYQGYQYHCKSSSPLKSVKEPEFGRQIFKSICNVIHALYYKVESTS